MGKNYRMTGAILIGILCFSDAYSLYGNHPTFSHSPHSFATFATTNSFHYTNKNLGSNYLKSPQIVFPTYKNIPNEVVNSIDAVPVPALTSSSVELQPINEKRTVDESTLKEANPVTEELVKSEVTQPDPSSVAINNGPENNDPFQRPPTIHRVTYSIPVNQPDIASPVGKYIYQAQQGVQSLAVVVPNKDGETKIEPAPQALSPEVPRNENQPSINEQIDKDDEFQFNKESISTQDLTQNMDQTHQSPPRTNIPSIGMQERSDSNVEEPQTFFFPTQRPPTVSDPGQAALEPHQQLSPIDNRQDSNVEQPETFFFAPQRQPSPGRPNHPSLELPVPGSNRFALPPSPQSNPAFPSSQPTPTPPAPTFFPGANYNLNRFAAPQSPQPGNQQPPPPGFPFPRNLFPGGGPPPPGQEPENGYNPFHQYEQFPEPPYESEFANEPPLQDEPVANSQRSAGPNPPLPPPEADFAQSTLRNVRTEELIEVTRRKQVAPGCAYNTISYGPGGEDCIQIRKR